MYAKNFHIWGSLVVHVQWRILDLPDGEGALNSQSGGANLLLGQIFTEYCIEMKENGPRGARPWRPL